MTYSIAGTDSLHGEVGGAGASCVAQFTTVDVIYFSAPGHGVVHAQAALGGPGGAEAQMRVMLDEAPVDIIAAITDLAFDPNAQRRQYGIVDLSMRSAGFTGNQTLAYADDRQGVAGAYTYSVQGNILTGSAVLDQATAAFEGGGCDLADRLMLAL